MRPQGRFPQPKPSRTEKAFGIVFAIAVVISLAFTAGIIFVAIHFLSKVW